MSGGINQNDTLACTYASLMLSDAGVPITAENIEAACKASGVAVRNTLPIIFARFLEKKSIESLLAAATVAAPAAGSAAAAPAAGGAAPAKEDKKAKVEEEEEDDDMGFGLFD